MNRSITAASAVPHDMSSLGGGPWGDLHRAEIEMRIELMWCAEPSVDTPPTRAK